MRILLIDADPVLAESIELMLRQVDLNTYVTDSGEEGIELAKLYDYDLILLDLSLPDIDGFEVLRKLRRVRIETPALILSGIDGADYKVKGFGFGADDYMTKPFDREELIARIHAIVRRSKGHAQSVIKTGKIAVNLDAKTVEADGHPVHLTGKEYQVLELLSLRKGSTINREMFLNHLYGGMDEPEAKIIDVFICKLRKKLALATGGANYIETVPGRGYVLRGPENREHEPDATPDETIDYQGANLSLSDPDLSTAFEAVVRCINQIGFDETVTALNAHFSNVAANDNAPPELCEVFERVDACIGKFGKRRVVQALGDCLTALKASEAVAREVVEAVAEDAGTGVALFPVKEVT